MKKEVYVLGAIAVIVIAVGLILFKSSAPDPKQAGTAVDKDASQNAQQTNRTK